jgi:hypothetical protein
MAFVTYLYSLVLLVISGVTSQSLSTVSITIAPGYTAQRQCAQCALMYIDNLECYGTPGAQDYLNCGGVPLNQCYCRADFSSEVSVFLSTNIASNCQPGPNTDDISTAESIYSQYCATALEAAPTETTATANPGSTATAGPGTTVVSSGVGTSTSVAVSTTTSGSSSSALATTSVSSKWLSLLLFAIQIVECF